MSVDEKQVGGDHYKRFSDNTYQHWNWTIRCGLGYLEGNATKYITRWRKTKTGPNDLRKALHYIEKLISSVEVYQLARRNLTWVRQETRAFAIANQLSIHEAQLVHLLATWETPQELRTARLTLLKIFDENGIDEVEASSVPATDSNKHAERSIPGQYVDGRGIVE